MANKGVPQKKGMTDFIIYIVIAVVLLIGGMWVGYVLQENTSKSGKVNYQKALNNAGDYANLSGLLEAADAAMNEKGAAQKGAMFGGMAGLLIVAYQISQTPKRFHRKGEEHGSARWGTDKEKKIICDENDFYNNVFLAADVLLVLDRKEREKNALSEKDKKAKERAEELKFRKNAQRIEMLEKEIRDFQSSSDQTTGGL